MKDITDREWEGGIQVAGQPGKAHSKCMWFVESLNISVQQQLYRSSSCSRLYYVYQKSWEWELQPESNYKTYVILATPLGQNNDVLAHCLQSSWKALWHTSPKIEQCFEYLARCLEYTIPHISHQSGVVSLTAASAN